MLDCKEAVVAVQFSATSALGALSDGAIKDAVADNGAFSACVVETAAEAV